MLIKYCVEYDEDCNNLYNYNCIYWEIPELSHPRRTAPQTVFVMLIKYCVEYNVDSNDLYITVVLGKFQNFPTHK